MNEKTALSDCLEQAEVVKMQQSGMDLRIIDVRSPEEFQEQHIPGAINIPVDALEKNLELFATNTVLVTACGKGGGRSAKGTEILMAANLNAFWLCGGTFGWFD